MSAAAWHWSEGDTAPELIGTLERETDDDVFAPEDLTGKTVSLTLWLAAGPVYKADQLVAILSASEGRVKYTGVVADTKQGALKGKFFVTYADGTTKVGFPNTGRFTVRVSP